MASRPIGNCSITPRAPGAAALGAVLAGALVAGCGGPADNTGREEPRAASPVAQHVHGLGLDPTDGTVYVATHDGLFRAAAGAELAPVGTTGRDLMGFTMAGPGTILSSGHPGPGEDAANPLGLVRSTDGGASYTTLSLAGQVDFHALDVSSGTVYGLDAGRQTLRASTDGGTTWQDRATIAALDIAVDPADVASVLATVQGGVAASRDGGATFGAPTGPAMAYLSWAPDATVYGIALDGGLHTSTDGGTTWQQVGTVPGGRPQAVTGLDGGRVLAATAGGVYDSRDGGATFAPLS